MSNMDKRIEKRQLFEYSIGAVTAKPLASKKGIPRIVNVKTYADDYAKVGFTDSFEDALEHVVIDLLRYYRKVKTNGEFKALCLGRLDTKRENNMLELFTFNEKPKAPFLAAHPPLGVTKAEMVTEYTIQGVRERFLFPSIAEYTHDANWNMVASMILDKRGNSHKGTDWVMYHLPKLYDYQQLTHELLINELKRLTEDTDSGSLFHVTEKFHPQSSVKVVEDDGLFYLWDTQQGEFDVTKLRQVRVRHSITEFNFLDSFDTFQQDFVEPTKIASLSTSFDPDAKIDVYVTNASVRTYEDGDGEPVTVRHKRVKVLLHQGERKLIPHATTGNFPVYKNVYIPTFNLSASTEKETFEQYLRDAYLFVEHR